MSFTNDFVWGAATASYQVEGAAYEDGKGLSIWDVFSKEPEKTFQGHNGDVACDQYHLFHDDVSLMKQFGIQAYRFSISWARIFPAGVGAINEKGVAYYDSLVDELLANGITPYITLFHWDLPYALHQKGGWLNEEIVQWFGRYAAFISEHFTDRVKHFFTINEPQCFAGFGYLTGNHAPGWKVNYKDYFQIVHNLLRAHGQAVLELRSHAKSPIQIGFAPTGVFYYPSTESPEDIAAAKQLNFQCPDTVEALNWSIPFMSDPILFGRYPEDVVARFGEYMPNITEDDMKLISQPLDFYGQNIYNGHETSVGSDGTPEKVKRYDGFPRTSIRWPITPEVLRWVPRFLYERYHLPIYITENGMAAHDVVSLDNQVHDSNRIDFMHRYLLELRKASDDGAKIAGYFAWSLMDNFEWTAGYNERFGLIYVDYCTQQRTPKDSAFWYQSVIASNGENL